MEEIRRPTTCQNSFAISQKTYAYVTFPEPNASGYDSDNCATSAWVWIVSTAWTYSSTTSTNGSGTSQMVELERMSSRLTQASK